MPGLCHVLVDMGWDLADCGQEKHLGTCYATWEGMRAMLDRHGLTSAALAKHVLPIMPAPPLPPKPVSTLAEAKRALARAVLAA